MYLWKRGRWINNLVGGLSGKRLSIARRAQRKRNGHHRLWFKIFLVFLLVRCALVSLKISLALLELSLSLSELV